MSSIEILSKEVVSRVLTLPMAIEAVEQAYIQKYTGAGQVWPMVFHEFDPGHADLDIKSGNLDQAGIFGLKLVSWFERNEAKQLPALFGTSMLFDVSTGAPLAVLNASAMTALRTGAAGAIGAKLLANPDASVLLMVGCGGLAPYLIASALYLLPGIRRVLLTSPRTPSHGAENLERITGQVDALLRQAGTERTAAVEARENLEEAVKESQIIFTATPSREPVIQAAWVQPGTHLSCMGADISGKQETESGLLAGGAVFGDDAGQCLSVGECEKPFREGLLSGLTAEIGAVAAGAHPGRTDDRQITVFDSTGIALQDLACGAKVLEQCRKLGCGVTAEL